MQTSIIKHSETVSAGRIDAEFFHPDIRKNYSLIQQLNYTTLEKITTTVRRFKQPIYTTDESIGIPVLNSGLLKDSLEIDRARLGFGELVPFQGVLLNSTGVGTLGRVNINYLKQDFTLDSHVTLILSTINQYYLYIFLHSKFGQFQINQLYRGSSGQIDLYPVDIKKIQIPLFSEAFQQSIEDMVLEAHAEQEKANRLTKEANELLEKELGIYEWTLPKPKLNFSIRSYSETKSSNRIDAEYYQEKYDAILEKITSYKGGYSTIGNEFILNKDTFKIDKDKSYNYVEIGSINTGNGDISSTVLMGEELPANCKRTLYKNDILVSTVRPYRGAISIVDKDGYVGSGAFTVLQQNGQINKETLYTFLRLPVLLEYSLKPSTGTSYPTITDDDILNLKIPLINKKLQDQIASKISEAHQARQNAKSLLEKAKNTVEKAIEHGE